MSEAIDTTTNRGRLVFHLFTALAEFERGVIRERTLAGLEAAWPNRRTATVDERGGGHGGEGHAEGERDLGGGGGGQAERVTEHALQAFAGRARGAGVSFRRGGEGRHVGYRGYSLRRAGVAD